MSARSEQPSTAPCLPPPAPQPRTFLLAGGGTGGHVIPALAVARELRRRGHTVFFAGTTRGMESKLVPGEGFRLEIIEIGGLKRVGMRKTVSTLFQLPVSIWRSRGLLTANRVAAIFSMGGYVAGPPVIAALLRGTPVVIMEPNAVPGFTNRRIARFVARALISFPETARYFPERRTEVTGLPVREEFFALSLKPRTERITVLITGGSQGSRTLNRAARESWALFRQAGTPIRLIHQTGAGACDEIRTGFAACGLEGEVVPFISDMPAAFAKSDLVVSRSGAGAVAELAAAGKPAILSPFPFAADNHQLRNAEACQRAGAAVLIEDSAMTGVKLFETVSKLIAQPGELERMAHAARSLAHPGAASRAADVLEEVARA